MKPKYDIYYYFLMIGMLLVSGVRLIDRFLFEIPDVIEIICAVTGLILFIIAIYGKLRARWKRNQ